MDGNDAIAWVDQYMGLVNREIRKSMICTPYDPEDFRHDAYEAALLATGVSKRKGISFSTAFWHMFGKKAFRVSHSNAEKRKIGFSLSVSAVQKYSDEVFYGGEAYPPDPENLFLARELGQTEEEVLSLLAERLRPVEKRVFTCICGLEGKRMSLAETALFLGTSKGAVHQSFRRIMKKAHRFRKEREFTGQTENGEASTRKQQSCHRRS